MAHGVDAAARDLVLSSRSFEAGKVAYAEMIGSYERSSGAWTAWLKWVGTVEGLLPANDNNALGKAGALSFSHFCQGWLCAKEAV